ncbi:hypothetical protein HPB51_017699 [Rhipicephalus microplus]|uniref:THAP-type domain-containing protein n=1 Tax=Rhipicephalus microplus TaxID=6941 RepID=A0A9J6E358_RHIMP|nr:hypothetical protein HPB51_017699 [Rhipicephalus microplus]
MGRSCFVPRCRAGCKSCHEKFSLFSALKDEQRLNLWQRAIPRKDRLLRATDYACERHFEPELGSKSWTAEYKRNVLVSTPRRASLASNAVPTRFPDCPPYLSKTPKSRKRPAERHFAPPEKKRGYRVASVPKPFLVCLHRQRPMTATTGRVFTNQPIRGHLRPLPLVYLRVYSPTRPSHACPQSHGGFIGWK